MDVNCLCYILTELLVSGLFFPPKIVIVLTVSEPLQVLTMDQRSPGSYKTSFLHLQFCGQLTSSGSEMIHFLRCY